MHDPTHNPEDQTKIIRYLGAEADTLALGARLAPWLQPGMVLYLSGELGAGKTTLVRGILRGLGYAGRVKSPTFTLVELYNISRLYLYHFDFYRLKNAEESGEAGFREYFNRDSICLVEWPEKAAASLPPADIRIQLHADGTGRRVELTAKSEIGKQCLARLNG